MGNHNSHIFINIMILGKLSISGIFVPTHFDNPNLSKNNPLPRFTGIVSTPSKRLIKFCGLSGTFLYSIDDLCIM